MDIPFLKELYKDPSSNPAIGKFPTMKLGEIVSGLLNIALLLAAFLTFYFLVWGAFQYMSAKGNKEDLAKARARISWALVGLIVVFMAYLIATFAGEIFPPGPGRGGLPF